jgi:hypothetical protein
MERSVLAGNSLSKASEETFSIEEASTQLEKEKSKYIQIGNSILLKDSIGLAQKEYDVQSDILDIRTRELAEIEKIATRNEDMATLESVRTDRNKARVSALNSELNLIKTIRSEQGKILAGGTARGGQKALSDAERKKARIDKMAGLKTEETAVLARQKIENAKPSRANAPASMDVIRRMMAEEAVGLKTPEIQKTGLGIATGAPNGMGGAGGLKTSITPATALPSTGGATIPTEAGGGSKDSTEKLIQTVQSLVDRMKTGVVV